MARFVIRNYGPSRQINFKGQSITLSNDQSIETDDTEMTDVLGEEKLIHVTDRGIEAAVAVPAKKSKKKERKITADNVEALHAEDYPDADDNPQQTQVGDDSQTLDEDPDEISYDDLTIAELQILAKDRGIETSGLKIGGLIEALEEYDDSEVAEGSVV